MKKLVMLGIGVSGILSASVLAEGSSFFYALSGIANGQQPPAVKESSLAAIEGGVSFPGITVFVPFLPDIDFSDLPADCNNCNVIDVRPRNICNDPPCGPQNNHVTIVQ